MTDELAGAGITAKERLERIELLLDRVDRKLDSKVDIAEFMSLDQRVREIELHGTPSCQEVALTVKGIRSQVAYAAGAVGIVVVLANLIIPTLGLH